MIGRLVLCAGLLFLSAARAEEGGSAARGRVLFTQVWVPASPSAAGGFTGLGPVFNETSCAGCHVGAGRGGAAHGMLVRLSLPGETEKGGPKPLHAYGDQFHDRAIPGVPADGKVRVRYDETPATLGDGTRVTLRRPALDFTDLAFGPFEAGAMMSARIAQPLAGAALLEAIPESDILAEAKRQAHGHVNSVWDPATGGEALGRFGWKANQPSLTVQIAAAAHGDMGLTSAYFPDRNCPPGQSACLAAWHGPRPDLDAGRMADLVSYLSALPIPERRGADSAAVRRGETLFGQLGCAACHKPGWTLADGRIIHPYSDLLLHDMGPDLADGRPDFHAGPSEWRTAPLWGIGTARSLNPAAGFLHDGRARDLTEAVLWHGGEAEPARNGFAGLRAADREALLAFLGSL